MRRMDGFRKRLLHTHTAGFTLVEILVVIAIIAVIAVITLIALNPTRQRLRLYDIQRKRDLNNLKGLYSLFQSTNSRYPTGAEICYDTPVQAGATCSCHICGLEQNLHPFGQQVQNLYCDPEHPKSSYVYEYDCTDNPSWYKIYTHLSLDDKAQTPDSADATCRYGVSSKSDNFLEPYSDQCGGINVPTGVPHGGGGGGGGGGSPTATPTPTPAPTSAPSCPSDPVPKYCKLGGICNICGTFANCANLSSCDQPAVLYSNSLCTNACQ